MKHGSAIVLSLPNNQTAGYSSNMETMPAVVIDEEQQLKAAFAAALLKNPQDLEGRFKAALSVTADTGQALLMANKWVTDPFVVAEQKRLVEMSEDGGLDFIGTKADFAREVLDTARGAWDLDAKHKFYKLYAEARGFIVKADTNVNVQVNNNKVMIVKDLGTDAQWEEKARQQQQRLIDVSASKH